MRLKVLNIIDVAEGQLCCGCGACASAFPDEIEMIDVLDYGRRPQVKSSSDNTDAALQQAMAVCPGAVLEHDEQEIQSRDIIAELRKGWGPVVAMWEGWSSDPAIRHAGSSGGAASGLSLYAIEKAGMDGVLHTGARDDVRFLNESVISRSREQLLERTGSRYAPASPVDGLHLLEPSDDNIAFVGKPCDVAGLNKLTKLRPELAGRIGITIAFFCAGAPSTKGTLELIEKAGIEDPSTVTSLRYRGNGWPGMWTVVAETEDGEYRTEYTYAESWNFLQRYRQWRCYICPDHTGEFADIAVGDPWYREVQEGEEGSSLILARTERGRQFIEAAIADGYLTADRVEPRLLPDSQPNLLNTRGGLWGRLIALRLAGAPVPEYGGMPLFPFWLRELSLKEKAQSIYGTIKRVFRKRLKHRIRLTPWTPPAKVLHKSENQLADQKTVEPSPSLTD